MKSISLDTSAKQASISLFDNDNLIAEYFINTGFTHSQTIMTMLDSMLKICKTTINNVDEFIITKGPGSFTGLRIGLATIKGLAISKNKPCKSISTLESLAYNIIDFDGIICPAMDARCNQVYTGIFSCKNKVIQRLTDDMPCSISELSEILKNYKNIILLGDGAELCYNSIDKKTILNNNISVSSHNLRFQKSSSTFFAAKNHEYISVNDLHPSYLRLSQAERQFLEKRS